MQEAKDVVPTVEPVVVDEPSPTFDFAEQMMRDISVEFGFENDKICFQLRNAPTPTTMFTAIMLEHANNYFVRCGRRGRLAGTAHALAAAVFFQSARNWSCPLSVNGCLSSCWKTLYGIVAMSAPMRAASIMWMGCRK